MRQIMSSKTAPFVITEATESKRPPLADFITDDMTPEEKIHNLSRARAKISASDLDERTSELRRAISLAMEELVASRYLLR
jgi:hypothetical protein